MMLLLAIRISSSDGAILWVLLALSLLAASGSIVWEIYKDERNSLFNQFKNGYLTETEYNKKLKWLGIYSIIGIVVLAIVIVLLLYLIGILLLFLAFLTGVVFKRSR